jgi:hypothetical protein
MVDWLSVIGECFQPSIGHFHIVIGVTEVLVTFAENFQ